MTCSVCGAGPIWLRPDPKTGGRCQRCGAGKEAFARQAAKPEPEPSKKPKRRR